MPDEEEFTELDGKHSWWKAKKEELQNDKRSVFHFKLPKNVVEFTYLLADHCEMTWHTLDLSRSMMEVDVDEASMGEDEESRNVSESQANRNIDGRPLLFGRPLVSESASSVVPAKRRRIEDLKSFIEDIKAKQTQGGSIREEIFQLIGDLGHSLRFRSLDHHPQAIRILVHLLPTGEFDVDSRQSRIVATQLRSKSNCVYLGSRRKEESQGSATAAEPSRDICDLPLLCNLEVGLPHFFHRLIGVLQ